MPSTTVFNIVCGFAAAVLASTAAHAAVTISLDATQNMVCSAGVCAPTAKKAVLNAGDLDNLLASGNVTVTTTGSSVQAKDIHVTAAFGWASQSLLSLDAHGSIAIDKAISISGLSGLSLATKHGGTVSFGRKGSVGLQNLSSQLTINGKAYVLVNSIAKLARAIANDSHGRYALASGYDASADGTYKRSPINFAFGGTFEALGNAISNLTIAAPGGERDIGLFPYLQGGTVRDIGLVNASVTGSHYVPHSIGALVGDSENGTIEGAYVTGKVAARTEAYLGGLVGYAIGATISRSYSAASVSGGSSSGGLLGFGDVGTVIALTYSTGDVSGGSRTAAGGLVGESFGTITQSYASGAVSTGPKGTVGGLVSVNSGSILQTYALGAVSGEWAGGLVGDNNNTISDSYSTGAVSGATYAGGFVGFDNSTLGSITNCYWDTTTSGITNLSQGAGNISNDPGITGLTTQQLQSGLPAGFDPAIWAEQPKINGGLPYLLANPPPK